MKTIAVACLLFVGCATSGVTPAKVASAAVDCTMPEIAANVQNIITALEDVRSGVAVPADLETALANAGEADLKCAIQALTK
jgi:hypothetical protein